MTQLRHESPPTTATARAARLELLDVIRFAAAAMVVCFHYLFNGIAGGKVLRLELSSATEWAKYGYLGVTLFFVISGFVITRSTRGRSARHFFVGRAVRLLPAYWCAVLITATAASWLGGRTMSVTPVQVLANLTMVPPVFGQDFVDGVYWTLLIELQFYLLVFLVLLGGLGRWLERLMPYWALLMLGATLVGIGAVPYLGGYMAYFAAGAIIGSLQTPERHVTPGRERLLQLVGLGAAGAVGVWHAIAELPSLELSRHTDYDPWVVLVLVTGFHLLLLAFCWPPVARLRLRGAAVLGALTYPVYLLHAHLGYMTLNLLGPRLGAVGAYSVAVLVVAALSFGLYLVVEKRLRHRWYQLFGMLAAQPARVLAAARPRRRPGSHDTEAARDVVLTPR